jgi:hypothetical protein
MIYEFKWIWHEVVLFWHLSGRAEENYETCLALSSTLKMEATYSSEIKDDLFKVTVVRTSNLATYLKNSTCISPALSCEMENL